MNTYIYSKPLLRSDFTIFLHLPKNIEVQESPETSCQGVVKALTIKDKFSSKRKYSTQTLIGHPKILDFF